MSDMSKKWIADFLYVAFQAYCIFPMFIPVHVSLEKRTLHEHTCTNHANNAVMLDDITAFG